MNAFRALGTASCLLFSAAFAAAEPTATEQLTNAETVAKKEHKNVFLIFHASWCGWCHRLEKMMNSPEAKPIFDANYVIVTLDVDEHDAAHPETPGGAEMKAKLGAKD